MHEISERLLPVYTGYIQIMSGLVDSDWWRTDRADSGLVETRGQSSDWVVLKLLQA